MSDDTDHPAAPSSSPPGPSAPLPPRPLTSSLLQFLAIGRLTSDAQGELLPDKHRIVAHNFTRAPSSMKEEGDDAYAASIKAHCKTIMKRAGHKLIPGKRIRLKDEGQLYEVHIFTDEAEGDHNKILVFFAITSLTFPKYHSVSALLKDVKGGFYQTVDSGTLWSGGSVQRACQPYFTKLTNHYNTSPLLNVVTKADEVRDVMLSSVTRALSTVENLEEMDEKAELFEDQSKKFHKRSEAVAVVHKSKYRWVICMMVTIVLIILAYFIIPAVIKSTSSSSTTIIVTGSTGSGSGSSSAGGYSSSSTGSSSSGTGH